MSPGNGGCARISSPAPGGSILMTSAPMSANILPHIGPETICANSITIRSSKALPVTRAPPEQGRRDYNPKFAAARNPTYRSVCVLPYDGSILRIAFWPASTFHSEVLVMAEFDLIVKNGMVVDGTRAPRFRSDIGIKNGRIAKIGRISAHQGAKVVDAGGQIVAPGFIDLHTHYDAQIFWDPYLTISGYHGVTSVVLGNCGFGFAPVRPKEAERSMLTMVRTEAIPLRAMQAAMPFDWESYPQFLDKLDTMPKGINLLPYVPMNPLLGY